MVDQQQTNDRGLTREEREYLEGSRPSPTRTERRRPGWLVVGMVWATFGIYIPIWIGLNWGELKRQLRDDRMRPVWHGLAMFVPIYSFFRFHSNFRVINEQLVRVRSPARVRPMLAVLTYILGGVLLFVTDVAEIGMPLAAFNAAAALAAFSWTIHHGQTGMNAYWDALSDQPTTDRVPLWERLLIAAGVGLWIVALGGAIAGVEAA